MSTPAEDRSREMQAAKHNEEEVGLREFDRLIYRHNGYGISNFVRTLTLGLSAALIADSLARDGSRAF